MFRLSVFLFYTFPLSWDEVVREGLMGWKGRSLLSVLCKLDLGSSLQFMETKN
jgi:hypothetical protein